MRVLVCGSRNVRDWRPIWDRLDSLSPVPAFLIAGDAKGVDSEALAWANMHGIPNARFGASWDILGRSAGPIRNANMLKFGKPDLVIAFPGGRGTANMITSAERAGVRIISVTSIELLP